jgi:hypothetical protein
MATAAADSPSPPPVEPQEAVIVHAPTQPLPQPPAQPREATEMAVSTYQADYSGASVLRLDAEAIELLAKPFPNEAYDIKPTGEVFVSQVHYRRRLNQVFAPGQWALIPRAGFRRDGNALMREYELRVRGHYISEAVGECEYQETNDRMTWADAAEGVKSNALTRACKDLGIASECWDRQFASRWRDEHCIQAWVNGKPKPQWRRLDAPPFYGEDKPTAEWAERHNGGSGHGAAADVIETSSGPLAVGSGERAAAAGAEQNPAYVGKRPKADVKKSAPASAAKASCPQCTQPAGSSRFPKAGKTHYCYDCKRAFDPSGATS